MANNSEKSIWQRIIHRVRTKKGYKYVAEFLAFIALIAVIYVWWIIIAVGIYGA